jgi:hypothetical protein
VQGRAPARLSFIIAPVRLCPVLVLLIACGSCQCECCADPTAALCLCLDIVSLPILSTHCLQGLPLVNVELWAKLARAAAGAKVWAVALECSKAAASVSDCYVKTTE